MTYSIVDTSGSPASPAGISISDAIITVDDTVEMDTPTLIKLGMTYHSILYTSETVSITVRKTILVPVTP